MRIALFLFICLSVCLFPCACELRGCLIRTRKKNQLLKEWNDQIGNTKSCKKNNTQSQQTNVVKSSNPLPGRTRRRNDCNFDEASDTGHHDIEVPYPRELMRCQTRWNRSSPYWLSFWCKAIQRGVADVRQRQREGEGRREGQLVRKQFIRAEKRGAKFEKGKKTCPIWMRTGFRKR